MYSFKRGVSNRVNVNTALRVLPVLCLLFLAAGTVQAQLNATPICAALDMSTADCALITRISTLPPANHPSLMNKFIDSPSVNTPWNVSEVRTRGNTSMRSGGISDSQSSCLVLGVALPAGSLVSFSLRTDSEGGGSDRLLFAADDHVLLSNFSALRGRATREWEQRAFAFKGSVNNLIWCYIKDGSHKEGLDSGWVDALSFLIKDEVCSALDMSTADCALITQVSAMLPENHPDSTNRYIESRLVSTPWYVSEVRTRGATSMRSGDVSDAQSSCLVLGVALPAGSLINFSLRTDSEGSLDRLLFAADDQVLISNFSAPGGRVTREWERQTLAFSDSVNTLHWCYAKNDSDTKGADSGWVDALSFLTRDGVCSALDMDTADCALITGVSTMVPANHPILMNIFIDSRPANTPWVISEVQIRGATSMRSGDIEFAQSSCLVLGIALPAGSIVNFSLRTDSDGFFDRLLFAADNQVLISSFSAPKDSVTREWEQQTFALSGNVNTLRWCYTKNGRNSRGADSGWVDALSFLTKNEVCSALDMSTEDCARITGFSTILPAGVTLPQEGAFPTAATNVPWFVSPVRTRGTNSLRSGDVDHREGSCLVLAVSLPVNTRVRFSLRTNSEGRYDRLAFFADDRTVISNFSAPARSFIEDWTAMDHRLTSGVSRLSWCYLKNGGNNSRGEDSGWLDNLSFLLPSSICTILDMSDKECALINSTTYEPPELPWTASTIATKGNNSLTSRSVSHDQQSCLILNVSLPSRTLVQFSRRVSALPPDELYFSVDNVRQDYSLRPAATTTLRDWSREAHILFDLEGNTVLRWCYAKDLSDQQGEDRAWIDDLSLVEPPTTPLNRELVCLVLDMSTEDCQLITSYASEPAAPAWYISYYFSEGGAGNGKTSLRNDPAVTHNQTSCLVLGVALPDHRMIRFFLRSDSEGGNDFLYFEADGFRLVENFSAAPGSEFRTFEEVNVLLLGHVKTLKWCYTKNGDIDAGDDSGWLDRLSFSTVDDLAAVALTRGLVCQVLDMSTKDCARITSVSTIPHRDLVLPAAPISRDDSIPVDVSWRISTTATKGGTSLRSGAVGHLETSCLVLGVSLPAATPINFSLRTDSEAVADRLVFAADNELLIENFSAPAGSITSIKDWESLERKTTMDTSRLTWCYLKNRATTEGEDSGWLDALSFTVPLTIDRICSTLDMSNEDCARITSVSTIPHRDLVFPAVRFSPGDSIPVDVPWLISITATKGGTSLRSGAVGHLEASCLVLGVSLPAATPINFSLRSDSEARLDRLVFAADNELLVENFSAILDGTSPIRTTLRDWELLERETTMDISRLTWCYLKNNSGFEGEDSGWLDALAFTAPLTIDLLCSTLDMSAQECALITSVGFESPTSPWVISTTATVGDTSLRSAIIDDNQQSCLVIGVALPGQTVVQFARRVSSQPGADRLYFAADGQRMDFSLTPPPDTVLRDWRSEPYFLPASISSLTWCYRKNGSISEGEDRAWLDDLSLTAPENAPLSRYLVCLVLDMNADECALITSVSATPPAGLVLPRSPYSGNVSVPVDTPWFVSPVADRGDHSLRSGDIKDSQASCLVLGVTLPIEMLVSFSLRTDSEAVGDRLIVAADNELLEDNFSAPAGSVTSIRGWESLESTVAMNASHLIWCYLKDANTPAGADSGWLDSLRIRVSPELICRTLDMSDEDCSYIDSVSFTGGNWKVTTEFSQRGGSSLQSPALGNGQNSCIVLEVSIPGNRYISVYQRLDTDRSTNVLEFGRDDRTPSIFSYDPDLILVRDWEPQLFYQPEPVSTLTWCIGSAGEGRAWIDNLRFLVNDGIQIAVTSPPVLQGPLQDFWQIEITVTFSPDLAPFFNNEVLRVSGRENITGDSVHRLNIMNQAAGVTVTAVPINLLAPSAVRIEVEFREETVATQTVFLPTAQKVGDLLIHTSPTVSQSTVGSLIELDVTVSGTNNLGVKLFRSQLQLAVTNAANTLVIQKSYPLIFTDGTATAVVTVGLLIQGLDGRVELAVISSTDSVEARASVQLRAVQIVRALTINAPPQARQGRTSAAIRFVVTATATNSLGDPYESFESENLILQVMNSTNAVVTQGSYNLFFAKGIATTTVEVELETEGQNGEVRLQVARDGAIATETVTLIAADASLAALRIDAPQQARQGRTNEAIRFIVTVSATNSLGSRYESQESGNLILQVMNSANADVMQARYDLFFANGIATTTVEVGLQTEGQNGEVRLQVARDGATATATVTLIAAAESLAALRIEAPAIVHQPQLDATVDFAVTVSATGTLGNAFDPQGLQLQVSAGDNTTSNLTSLPLIFSDGTATATVSAGLLIQGLDGRVELAVISSTDSVEARASVQLRAVQVVRALTIDAPQQARQGRTNEAIRFIVTVSATNSLGTPYESFESENLILRVMNSANADVMQARYDLFFANGIATTTVEVGLQTEGQNGEVRLQVARDGAIATATVTLIAAAESLAALQIDARPLSTSRS